MRLNLEKQFRGASRESRNSTSVILITSNSAWARNKKRGFSLPVSGQRLIMFFDELIMSRIQNDVIAVLIL